VRRPKALTRKNPDYSLSISVMKKLRMLFMDFLVVGQIIQLAQYWNTQENICRVTTMAIFPFKHRPN
jgi:hypothetical protein